MEIINDTPFSFGCIAGRIPFPSHSLTLIVKATFDLIHDGVATPSEEQLNTTGDEFYEEDEDMQGEPRYASDFAYYKPCADLSLAGHCHAPKGTLAAARRVTFSVGDVSRSLTIYGDRHWIGPVSTDPVPFSSVPLRYEYSFGGEGFKKNPSGRGYSKTTGEDGDTRRYLPNITRPGEHMATPVTRLDPAGFGPFNREWTQRKKKLGTYTGKYLSTQWPWFAENMDWGYFNSSPEELQTDFLNGDETLYFENLNQEHPNCRSKLPGLKIRCFVSRDEAVSNAAHPFSEVSMNLDTLWVDMDAEKLVLVWRGWTQVLTEEFEDLRQAFIVSEELDRRPESVRYYQDRLQQRLREEEEKWAEAEPPEAPDPEIDDDTDKLIAEAEESYKKAMIDAGMDPENPPEPSAEDKEKEKRILEELGVEQWGAIAPEMTREIVIDQFADTKDITGLNLENLDLSGIDFSGGKLNGAVLSHANLSGAVFVNADLTETVLEKANLASVNLQHAVLENADFTAADLSGANLCKALMTDAVFDHAKMTDARIDDADASGASFIEADLSGASFANSVLSGADFSVSNLSKVNFTGANLAEATVEGAQGPGVVMDEANVTELRASEKCNFTGGSFKMVSGKESIWEEADLSGSDFSFSKMEGASFSKANLTNARFRAADMKNARFEKAILKDADLVLSNLLESSFERADLSHCDCRKANFYGSEFLNTTVEGSQFEGANLKMTKLVKK
ncbi:MAG: DUF2169 domain-containing protein [Desulfosarcina sp.]|nr:DUF2169 domain-containing protein [Desulfosarcina sp.]MBC2741660.1 DUF2169 domain-containing protein [Desulfosarcina sp.]MBC2764574.1 pentapeptide repeat-containing protein [Desulfosarcina sp.]